MTSVLNQYVQYIKDFVLTVGGVSMESCIACPAGHYCSSEGLASPSGPCSAGFYCPFDFSSTTPYAFLCPKVCLFVYTSSFPFFIFFHFSLFFKISLCSIVN